MNKIKIAHGKFEKLHMYQRTCRAGVSSRLHNETNHLERIQVVSNLGATFSCVDAIKIINVK